MRRRLVEGGESINMRQNSVSGISDILSVSMLKEVIAQLAEPTLAAFTSKLVPTESPERIIGVRMPALRRLAKQLLSERKLLVKQFLLLKLLSHVHTFGF